MTIEPVPTSVASMWHAAAERWGVSPRTALLLWLAPFALMIVVAGLRLLAHPLWRELAHDEGPLEVIQFLCLLAAAGFSVLVGLRLRRDAWPRLAALFCVLALGLAFVGGEVVAWGQWLLHFDTPARMA